MDNCNGHPVSEMCSFEYVDSAVVRSQKNLFASKRSTSAEMSDRDFQMRLVQLDDNRIRLEDVELAAMHSGSQLMNLYDRSRSTMHMTF